MGRSTAAARRAVPDYVHRRGRPDNYPARRPPYGLVFTVTADAVHGSGICLYAHMFELATGIRTTADSPRPGRAKPRANVDRLQATPSDARNMTGGPGVAVQIRPSRLVIELFRIYFHYARANKRANLLCNGPPRGARRSGTTASLSGHVPTRQSQAIRPAKGSKIAEPPRICTATPITANRRTPSPASHEPDVHRAVAAADVGRPRRSSRGLPRPAKRDGRLPA